MVCYTNLGTGIMRDKVIQVDWCSVSCNGMLDFIPYGLEDFCKRGMVRVLGNYKLVEKVGFKEANDWAASVRSNKVVC